MPSAPPSPHPAPAALYEAVKEHIRRRIREGHWRSGDRVASEHELVAELGVSRMTANRALRELAQQGVLVRVAGVGTFVAEEKPKSPLLRVANLGDEIRARGHAYACDLIRAECLPASPEVAEALELDPGSPVFHALCVHREEGLPIQLEDRYVNPAAAPAFLEQDYRVLQPGEYLLRTVPLDEVEHVVDAVAASAEEAALLGLKPGTPCLVLNRRTWSGGLAVTCVRCTHPGSRYRLGSRFRVSGPQVHG